ncbi:MAG: hypothetical protein IJ371_01830 [Clostridia bacterium]|nr:hypothetical protein [Clostridia bacterium]
MKKLLSEWQERLGLQDWHIVLQEDVSPNDMVLQSVSGECEKDEVNKCAVVRIMNEKDYGSRILPFDKEKVLVHELLHIKFWLIENTENEMQNRVVHQIIDDIARALVNAKRSKCSDGEKT